MDNIEERLLLARESKQELENLMIEYMPYVKKQISSTQISGLEYDDKLSIAMLTFVNCVQQYESGKGSFLSFCAVSIRNRIIDEGRREYKRNAKMAAFSLNDEEMHSQAESKAAIDSYNREKERENLACEIDELAKALLLYELTFAELSKASPKQERARKLCSGVAKEVLCDNHLLEEFSLKKRLPQAELAKRCNLSVKTIEKHKKYIIALCVILKGSYPAIKAFLPFCKEVE